MALSTIARKIRATYEPGTDDPWWYDNVGHFMGGIVVAGAVSFVWTNPIVLVMAFLMVAGIWELFEYVYNIRPWDERENWSFDRAVEDTLLDTAIGVLGALLVIWVI